MSLKRVKTIVKSFVDKLPEGESWYNNRLEICSTCEYNTKNIPKDQLKISEKVKIASGICDDDNFCTACGCCIIRKAAVKSEDCGLSELDMSPKWNSLVVQSKLLPSITIENLTPKEGVITTEDTEFVYDFGIRKDDRLQFKFRINRLKSPLIIKAIRPGCSCTSIDNISEIDKNTTDISVSISTKGFRDGVNGRKIYVEHYLTQTKVDEIPINLKVSKAHGK